MQLSSIEQFPLDLFARLQADRSGERLGEADVKSRLLTL
jgi:hypothetical protein